MERVVDVASYISQQYRRSFGRQIDEMKLHKLLYFVQRKSIAETNEPMFEDTFCAWKYGPVLPIIRSKYKLGLLEQSAISLQEVSRKIVDSVMHELAGSDSMLLSSISHGEVSWRRAHERSISGCGSDVMSIADIREDAMRYKQRCELLKVWREYKQSMSV